MTWDFVIVLFIVIAVPAGLILRSRLRARAKAKAREKEQNGNQVNGQCDGVCEGCSFADKEYQNPTKSRNRSTSYSQKSPCIQ